MSKVIYKQPLDVCYVQEVKMPEYSRIVHLAVQNGKPCMWYECDPNSPEVKVTIRMYYTGEKMPIVPGKDQCYLGTALLHDGTLVVHFYYEVWL